MTILGDSETSTVIRRCDVCKLAAGSCVCELLPFSRAATDLLLVQHAKEQSSQSDTARLVHRVVRGSGLLVYGERGERFELPPPARPDTRTAVLFPLPGASVLTDRTNDPKSRLRLIVLDATWRQAKRMSRKIGGLREFPFVTLPESSVPRWRLREPRGSGRLNTAEAVAVALRLLGDHDTAEAVENALSLVAREILKVRGKLPSISAPGSSVPGEPNATPAQRRGLPPDDEAANTPRIDDETRES